MFKSIYESCLILLKKIVVRCNNNTILLVPHLNCKNDNYDIINYKSDNVLCLFNSIIKDSKYNHIRLYIIYYDREKLPLYMGYCKDYHPDRIFFIHYQDKILVKDALFRSKIVFTDNVYSNYRLRSKRQKVVCLNYYPFPYKSDYISLYDASGRCRYFEEQRRINKYYDYLISQSDMASIAITQAVPFLYENCITLGYPRSDVFYQDNRELRDRIEKLFPFAVNKIIIYVPTHRDYENIKRKQYDENNIRERSIWGYETVENLSNLSCILEENKAIIIAKIHPAQAKNVINSNNSKRVILYNELSTQITTSLNEMMAISDAMITDYTSAVYDFLHVKKPIVYYQYDKEKYLDSRGFLINPMEPLCAGEYAYNLKELVDKLKNIFIGRDEFIHKRHFLLDLIVTYKDNKSADRVKNYFLLKN